MKRFTEWIAIRIAHWLFMPPIKSIKPLHKTFTEIAGWDDFDCFYGGEYEITWEKKYNQLK